MLTSTRQARIAANQARARDDYVDHARDSFADQVPREYRRGDIRGITEGDGNWSGRLDRSSMIAARRYLSSPTRFLLLTGPTGTGKSTAAVAIADELIATLERQAKFVTATTMMSMFSFGSGDRNGADVLSDLSSVPILVIDDIGSANDGMTSHQQRSLWSLIDTRWSNRLYTIITSNMSISSHREGNGLMDVLGESAWDRIRDSHTHLVFDGESFRGQG